MFGHDDNEDDDKKIDLSNLDDIIKRCEGSMVSPWKKKDAPAEEAPESPDEEKGEMGDFSDMDIEDLLQMYNEMKGKQ